MSVTEYWIDIKTQLEGSQIMLKFGKYGIKKVVLGVNSLNDILKLKEKAIKEAIPFSVIVDRKGKVQFARAGEIDWNDPEAIKLIESNL